jgi:hypothetical protein
MLIQRHRHAFDPEVLVSFLIGCAATWCAGCSRHDAPELKGDGALGKTKDSASQAFIQSMAALLSSADTVVVEPDSKESLSSDLRQQLMRIVADSVVTHGGIQPGEAVGSIPPPPIPPPAFVLWVVGQRGSPTDVRTREDVLAVLEVHVEWGTPFAQAYQPGKKGIFLLENDEWRSLGVALVEKQPPNTIRN